MSQISTPLEISLDASSFIRIEDSFACVRVDAIVYPLDAILKTAYQFTQSCYVHIEPCGEHQFCVRLKPKQAQAIASEISGDFCNALVDQTLRLMVAQETEAIRNLILAHAFSRTALIEPDLETGDYINDPRGIAQPDRSEE